MSQTNICSSRLLEEGSEDLSDAPMKGLRDPYCWKKNNLQQYSLSLLYSQRIKSRAKINK